MVAPKRRELSRARRQNFNKLSVVSKSRKPVQILNMTNCKMPRKLSRFLSPHTIQNFEFCSLIHLSYNPGRKQESRVESSFLRCDVHQTSIMLPGWAELRARQIFTIQIYKTPSLENMNGTQNFLTTVE